MSGSAPEETMPPGAPEEQGAPDEAGAPDEPGAPDESGAPGEPSGGPEEGPTGAPGQGSGSDSSAEYRDSDISGHLTGGEEGVFGEGDESQYTMQMQDEELRLIADVTKQSDESEEEAAAEERKMELKHLDEIIAQATHIQDATFPTILKYPQKEAMKGSVATSEDTTFLKSMEVAERGYINRLRPESTGERPTVSQYQIRPDLENKFKPLSVKELIHSVLNDELGGKEYSEEEAKMWSQSIANTIRTRVKEMGFPRYKFVVQCVIGEEHGAGVKIGSRCLWDADTDNYASDTFLNETIFCMTVVYAVYFY